MAIKWLNHRHKSGKVALFEAAAPIWYLEFLEVLLLPTGSVVCPPPGAQAQEPLTPRHSPSLFLPSFCAPAPAPDPSIATVGKH